MTVRDDDGEAARPMVMKKKKLWVCKTHGRKNKKRKNKPWVCETHGRKNKKKKKKTISDPRQARWRDPFLHLSSFFFLFSFFLVENLVLLGVEFFCTFSFH
jgi:hypothetical protein